MLYYARSDTHYLLFIYDSLRNALLDASQGKPDSMRAVLRFSEETALDVYEKELYDFESGMGPNGWMSMARKWMGTKLAGTTKAVFLAVHQWRDQLAREHDESQRYVLSYSFIFLL
jgi:exosome complex exonuclease RRP6